MKRLILIMVVIFALGSVAACDDGVGSCLSSGGGSDNTIPDTCKEEWTEEECQDWDDQEVNGKDWTFKDDTCDELGYTASCSDGTKVQSQSDCAED